MTYIYTYDKISQTNPHLEAKCTYYSHVKEKRNID